MKMKRVRDMEWQLPVMQRYRMACCDCGLVHNVDFRIMRVVRAHKNGTYTLEVEPNQRERLRVHMRASRNMRSTVQMRRKKAT